MSEDLAVSHLKVTVERVSADSEVMNEGAVFDCEEEDRTGSEKVTWSTVNGQFFTVMTESTLLNNESVISTSTDVSVFEE